MVLLDTVPRRQITGPLHGNWQHEKKIRVKSYLNICYNFNLPVEIKGFLT